MGKNILLAVCDGIVRCFPRLLALSTTLRQDEAPFADPHGLREAPRERSTPSSGVRSQLEVEGEGGLSMRAGTGVENTTGEERGGRRDFGERPPSSSSPPSLSSSLRVETAPQAAPSRAAEVPAADEGPRSSTGSAGRTSTSSQMTASKSRARGRGFQDILCVGFAVALCLNFGSITARGEGFFAAGLTCVSETTSDRVLVSASAMAWEMNGGCVGSWGRTGLHACYATPVDVRRLGAFGCYLMLYYVIICRRIFYDVMLCFDM